MRTNPLRNAKSYIFSSLSMSLMLFTQLANGQANTTISDKSATPKYKDANLAIEDRVADQLPRMTRSTAFRPPSATGY
jgi:hypothetical protein